jgi:hypothetical protein
VVVVTSEFETHARNMASLLGHADLAVLVMPYPLEARPDDELRAIAAEYWPQALELLGAAERPDRAAARTVRPSERDQRSGATGEAS